MCCGPADGLVMSQHVIPEVGHISTTLHLDVAFLATGFAFVKHVFHFVFSEAKLLPDSGFNCFGGFQKPVSDTMIIVLSSSPRMHA